MGKKYNIPVHAGVKLTWNIIQLPEHTGCTISIIPGMKRKPKNDVIIPKQEEDTDTDHTEVHVGGSLELVSNQYFNIFKTGITLVLKRKHPKIFSKLTVKQSSAGKCGCPKKSVIALLVINMCTRKQGRTSTDASLTTVTGTGQVMLRNVASWSTQHIANILVPISSY